MSAPSRPFASGYGILIGIIILWAATLGLYWVGKVIIGLLGSGQEGA